MCVYYGTCGRNETRRLGSIYNNNNNINDKYCVEYIFVLFTGSTAECAPHPLSGSVLSPRVVPKNENERKNNVPVGV